MAEQFTPIPVKGLKTTNSAAPTNDNAGVLPAVANAAAPAYTEGDQVLESVDLHGSTRVTRLNAAGVANSATAPDFVELTDGTNPLGTNTNPIRVSKDGSQNSVTDPIFTELTDGTNPLGTVSNPLITLDQGSAPAEVVDSGQLTTAAVAAGANTTLSVTLNANKAGNLLQVTASSSVRLKIAVQTVTSGGTPVTTTVRTFFTEAYEDLIYNPISDAIVVAAAATQMGKFQVVITNQDNLLAADVYASITREED